MDRREPSDLGGDRAVPIGLHMGHETADQIGIQVREVQVVGRSPAGRGDGAQQQPGTALGGHRAHAGVGPATELRGGPDDQVLTAWLCYQQVRSAHTPPDLRQDFTETIVATCATYPILEIARLGRTLEKRNSTFLSHFTTDRSSNGGTEAITRIRRTPPTNRPRSRHPRELRATHAPCRRRFGRAHRSEVR
ncbi:MAG: hypothetical protein ACYCTH_14580 [Cellulomonas sp.]